MSHATDRQNVGRVDHIIFIYRSRENQNKARQQLTEMLGIEDWDDLGEAAEGLYILISWRSGIELVCPTKPVAAFERHLEKHGEGFYCMVFGVADLDQAMAQVNRAGGGTPYVLGAAPAGVLEKFDVAREALVVGDVAGTRLMLGEFKRKA